MSRTKTVTEVHEVEQVEWFDDRFYKIKNPDGSEDFFPSVTTALGIIEKPWLKNWYGDLGTETAQYRSKLAKEKGSRIHQGIYDLLHRGYCSETGYPQEEYFQIYNFYQFFMSLYPKVLLNEVTVFSRSERTAGTLDMLIEIEDGEYDIGYAKKENLLKGKYVIDVKTGNFDKAYHYQTAAYANMLVELGQADHIQGTGILLTKSDTKKGWKLILRSHEEMQTDYKCYLAALELYRANGEDKPRVFSMPKELVIEEIFKSFTPEKQRGEMLNEVSTNGNGAIA